MNASSYLVVLALLATGCAWIDAADRDAFFDGDGDGTSIAADCDDDDPSVGSGPTLYADRDDDGFGDPNDGKRACSGTAGFVSNNEDCDDDDAAANPAQNWYLDADGDGFGDTLTSAQGCQPPGGYVPERNDCDDGDPAIHPGVAESCNGVDDDCDGVFDDADGDLEGAPVWYADLDHDGFGDANSGTARCNPPAEHVADDTDCDDDDRDAYPGAVEVCDDGNADEDCDGAADDDDSNPAGTIDWFLDGDGDGYGSGATTLACDAPTHYVDAPDDCDDASSSIHPNAPEVWYDGIDQGCDGGDDDDQDGDGSTAQSQGGDDCDDEDPSIAPDAVEVWYDAVDSDCDGGSDFDQDGDTYDIAGPTGFDCDDADESRYPGAPEFIDGLDADCDGKDAVCGATWRRVPDDFADLDKAIAAACAGDTIAVAAGDWPGPSGVVTKRVTVVGAGASSTTLVSSGNLTTFALRAGTLRDLTVRGQPGGIAVDADSSSNVYLNRVVVDGAGGLGVDATLSQALLVSDSEISGCSDLGGLYGNRATDLVVRRTRIANNDTGAGMDIPWSTDTLIEDCVFEDNVNTAFGGGLSIGFSYTTPIVRRTRFENNRGQYGAGLYMRDGGVVEDCEFVGNVAVAQGAMRLHQGDYDVAGLTFIGNNGGTSSAVAFTDCYDVNLSDLTVVSNVSGTNVFAVEVLADAIVAEGIYVAGNSRGGINFRAQNMDVSEVIVAGNGRAGLLAVADGPGAVSLRRITAVGNVDAGIEVNPWSSGASVTGFATIGNGTGIRRAGANTVTTLSCSVYGNTVASTNLGALGCSTVDPRFVTWGPGLALSQWDLHLAPDSPLIDAGVATELDVDGTRADVGAYLAGTDVLGAQAWMTDADNDGLYDGWELARGLNPLVDDTTYDPDGDTLDNGAEFLHGTHPALRDSDGDGLYDQNELTGGTDPLSPIDP